MYGLLNCISWCHLAASSNPPVSWGYKFYLTQSVVAFLMSTDLILGPNWGVHSYLVLELAIWAEMVGVEYRLGLSKCTETALYDLESIPSLQTFQHTLSSFQHQFPKPSKVCKLLNLKHS
jgi:hypothetical protein